MSDLELTKTRFAQGVWEGELRDKSPGAGEPTLSVLMDDKPVGIPDLAPQADGGCWTVRFAIPPRMLGEGTHTLLFSDASNGDVLESFSIIAGEALSDDIRAEVDLLRAELDMLKRAFRRHCAETG